MSESGKNASAGLDAGDILIARRGAASIVTFNRPRALNATNEAMRAGLGANYPRLARDPDIYGTIIKAAPGSRAFCAGGDVREIVALRAMGVPKACAAFADEYALCWLHECFSKPTVALIDGLVMGSGVGLTLYGTHRVAGAGYRFAMPETSIGLFPDCGLAHAFARMPHNIGVYLGLTGARIGPADAHALGLVTHCIEADSFAAIEAGLAEADPIDPILDALHRDPGAAPLLQLGAAIARLFAGARVEDICARLRSETGPAAALAGDALERLTKAAPLSLKITLRHILSARSLDLREVLIQDYRLACGCLRAADFAEGVRAYLIDKDQAPRWAPAQLGGVSDAMVDEYFQVRPDNTLELPKRQQIQAARV